jgi:predicted N-formylglutamate amidohydrolase
MPRAKPALEPLTVATAVRPGQFIISCEHASNRIPARYRGLGLSSRALDTHIAWDPGAREIARACARVFHCSCHEGQHSRLLIDLNRSLHHPRVIANESAGIPIPGNVDISKQERDRRIELYYAPYRDAVVSEIRRIVRKHGRCVHISVHSFTSQLLGSQRKADIGLLYDPRRRGEKVQCAWMAEHLRTMGYHVRFNYPYRGVNDGFTTANRRVFAPQEYLGVEIEVNQKLLLDPTSIRRVATHFAELWKVPLTLTSW